RIAARSDLALCAATVMMENPRARVVSKRRYAGLDAKPPDAVSCCAVPSRYRRRDASHPANAFEKKAANSSQRSSSLSNVAHHSTKAALLSITGVTRTVA